MTGMSVVNGAAGGWGSDQIVLRAEQLVPLTTPKIVIVSFLIDDIQRAGYSVYAGAGKPWFSIETGELTLMNVPVPRYSGAREDIGFFINTLGRIRIVGIVAERTLGQAW